MIRITQELSIQLMKNPYGGFGYGDDLGWEVDESNQFVVYWIGDIPYLASVNEVNIPTEEKEFSK